MNRVVQPLHIALALIALTSCAGRIQAEETEDIYTRTLRGTALILAPNCSGTGWIIDQDQGLMITNEHVVTNNAEVDVVFPEYDKAGRPVAELAHYIRRAVRMKAEVIDADGPRDLALIRLRERLPERVSALKLAAHEPRPADRVHSVGNPGASGALWVYSTGMIRQVYRKEWRYMDGPARTARVIEMQSPINPGDSGGPVVNDAGEIVGVVSGKKPDATLMSWCIAAAELRNYVAEMRPLIEPKTAAAFHLRGARTLDRGLAIRAVEDLSAALRLDPKSANILVDRAMAYRARKDYDLALDDITEAMAINSRHPGAFNVRGCIHTDRFENDEALKDFRKAIQINPKVPTYHANRAQAHLNKQELEQAIQCFGEALRLNPDVAEWYYRRGMAFEQQGKAQNAEQDYVQAVQRDPSYRERLTLHQVRVVRIENRTNQKVRVYIRYEGLTPDGKWAWLPGGTDALAWEFAPGESAVLIHEGRPVLARRMRIWADCPESKMTWLKVKDVDTWTAPSGGYRGGPKPEIFTYSFNP
jgi:tetratricopeptide (TPR) repeat protein